MGEWVDAWWMEDAACRHPSIDRKIFFADKTEFWIVAEARKVCEGCPVAQECLDFALENHEMHGVWGGKSVQERKDLTRSWPRRVRQPTVKAHGTTTVYSRGCRCQACKEANTRSRAWKNNGSRH